jgi:hypothetical protein
MSLLMIVVVLVLVGFGLWVINALIPMAGSIKTILNLVVIIAVIYWLLTVFGLIGNVEHLFNYKVK